MRSCPLSRSAHEPSSPNGVGSTQPRNRLLAALPAAEFERLRASLEPVELPLRDVITSADRAITHAYFVEDGLVSLVQPLTDGASVEVGLIGREGFVGAPLLLGVKRTPAEANIQLKGSALRITAEAPARTEPAIGAVALVGA